MIFFNLKSYTYLAAGHQNKVLLMLHGFNSSKEEVKDYFKTLGAELKEIGISSFAPDLFHQRDHLLSLKEQYEIVQESIQFLIQSGFKEIAVCGFSLGSFLAMKAAREFNLKKVFLLSPVFDVYEDLTGFLGLPIQDWINSGVEKVLYEQPGVGRVFLPREFLLEVKTLKNKFELAEGRLVLISGSEDFSAANHEKIRVFQPQSVLVTSHIFQKTDHIFNAFDLDHSKLLDVSRLILKSLEEKKQ